MSPLDPETSWQIAHGFPRCPATERDGVAVRRCTRAADDHTHHYYGPWIIGDVVRCVTPDCLEYVDRPESEVYCYACRVQHRLQEAAVAEYLAQEDVVMDQPEKFGVAHVRRRS
jgi:hypothetical protein